VKSGEVESLHFLRVGMKNYRAFLQLWAKWLQDER
jgi:CHAD domain-containing protein